MSAKINYLLIKLYESKTNQYNKVVSYKVRPDAVQQLVRSMFKDLRRRLKVTY